MQCVNNKFYSDKIMINIQWDCSKMDTIGELRFVLYKEVTLNSGVLKCLSTFQNLRRLMSIIMSPIQQCPSRGIPLYLM